jgi:hypothetical protein
MTTYIFRWDRHGRKGKRCVVLARGKIGMLDYPRRSSACPIAPSDAFA